MFVRVKTSFVSLLKLGGKSGIVPVQIKSSERRSRSFVHKHAPEKRFFNVTEKNHQFVLCGMDEEDLVLADIVGQIVVHLAGFGISERKVLGILKGFGDKKAVAAYERNKDQLLFAWYGSRLPPL